MDLNTDENEGTPPSSAVNLGGTDASGQDGLEENASYVPHNGAGAHHENADHPSRIVPAILADFKRRCGGDDDLAWKLYDTIQPRETNNQDRCWIDSRAQTARTLTPGSFCIDYRNRNGTSRDKSWSIRTNDGKLPKYIRPDDSLPQAYFTRGVDWGGIAGDPTRDLIITEGEIKSATVCLFGRACVGIGGVWNWTSKRGGFAFLPDLELNWKGRKATIIYDADIASKLPVKGALHALARELAKRGAIVRTKTLPPDGPKGIDDCLIQDGGWEKLDGLPEEDFEEIEALRELNAEFIYIRNINMVMEIGTGNQHSVYDFLNLTRNRRFKLTTPSGKTQDAHAGQAWLEWPERREATRLAFEPGQPSELADGGINLWKGWSTEPRQGDVSNLNEVLDHLCNGDAADHKWVEQWFACMIQNPGVKLYTAVVVDGLQGCF